MSNARFLAVYLGLSCFALHSFAYAAPAFVRVAGHGERKVAPDTAHIQIEIQSRNATAQAAQAKSAEVFARVEKLLKQDSRIEKQDIKTVHINVHPEYDYSGKGKPRVQGYLASHSLRVTYRDLERAGRLLDSLLAAGTSEAPVLLNSISFSIEKPEAYETETLALAMKQARNRADAIAKAAGKSVKEIRSVIQSGTEFQAPPATALAETMSMRAQPAGASTQLAPGEITLTADVTVEYEI